MNPEKSFAAHRILAISETIRELEEVPSGVLYPCRHGKDDSRRQLSSKPLSRPDKNKNKNKTIMSATPIKLTRPTGLTTDEAAARLMRAIKDCLAGTKGAANREAGKEALEVAAGLMEELKKLEAIALAAATFNPNFHIYPYELLAALSFGPKEISETYYQNRFNQPIKLTESDFGGATGNRS